MLRGTLNYLPSLATIKETIKKTYHAVADFIEELKYKPQYLEDRQKKKRRRDTAEYGHNVTPSIRLPSTPKKIKPPLIDTMDESPTTYYQLFTSLFYPKNKNSVIDKPRYEDNIPIVDKIRHLEKQIQDRLAANKEANIDDLETQCIETTWEQILQHAQFRADLFFYLLVAIYGKKVTINKDDTKKQHGVGSKELGTNACHSSLFPNIRIDPIPYQWLPPIIAKFFPKKAITLARTQFAENLNLTVEGRRLVNTFDCHLEGKVHDPSNPVRTMVNIANQVSNGNWTPKEGMDKFYQRMHSFFENFMEEDYKKVAPATPKALMKVYELEREGTFKGATKNHSAMREDYLYLLLELKPDQIQKIKWMPKFAADIYLESIYKSIQDKELFASQPTPRAKLSEAEQRAKEIRDKAIYQKNSSKKTGTIFDHSQKNTEKKTDSDDEDPTYSPGPAKK